MASASGDQSTAPSSASADNAVGCCVKTMSKRDGSAATSSSGFARTIASSSRRDLTITSAATCSSDCSAALRRPASAAGVPEGASNTTLPLLSSVRTCAWPSDVNSARRSAMATRLARPTLMPRSSATWLSGIAAGLRGPQHRPIVRDHRERIVEVMKQPLPGLVLGRPAKADFVRLERLPTNQQNVLVRPLDAALQLMRHVARHRRDDALGLEERRFEGG